jgi:Small-conductance mechanosensitive channel
MGTTSIILIIVLETLALCLFLLVIVVQKNRNLRQLVGKLQTRMQDLTNQYKKARSAMAPPTAPWAESYNDKLSTQIELTRDYHRTLGPSLDIDLDLDPSSPSPRRIAALRHAFLAAEKAAVASRDEIDWDLLSSRYRQILSFRDDDGGNGIEQEELEQLKGELNQARKRINNLERFKGMYRELEERWDRCKNKANEHYVELKNLALQTGQKENFAKLLDAYQATYVDLGRLIEVGFNESLTSMGENPEEYLQEIRRLRSVAVDQHKIITELQNKLVSAGDPEQRAQIVVSLQAELQKQARFLQESETCIKLMESELANNKHEMNILAEQLAQMPKLKSQLTELEATVSIQEQVVESLKQENRRLTKKLQTQEAPPDDNQEAKILRKELMALQAKYNDLEEKFLDLKLKE